MFPFFAALPLDKSLLDLTRVRVWGFVRSGFVQIGGAVVVGVGGRTCEHTLASSALCYLHVEYMQNNTSHRSPIF